MYDHFRYFWAEDRLPPILESDGFMEKLPKDAKRAIVANFIFDDFLHDFRIMLKPLDPLNDKMIESLLYGIMPRSFSHEKERNVIYDEGQEVLEMYFI
jgi:hypothetical protein